MEIKLKQRLIGGIVLIALAIILLPLLFNNSHTRSKQSVLLTTSTLAIPSKSDREAVYTAKEKELSSTTQLNSSTAIIHNDASQPNKKASQLAFGNPFLTATHSVSVQEPTIEMLPKIKNSPVKKIEIASANTDKESKWQQLPEKKIITSKKYITTSHKVEDKKPPIATAWVIQLGSFGDVQRAKLLVKQLRSQGYRSYTRPTLLSGVTMSRVFVGPEVKRAKANSLQIELRKKFKIDGVIVSYNPTLKN